MARPVHNGWDFVEQGKQYQYKEDWMIALVTVLEDNSDDQFYSFKLRVDKATVNCDSMPEFTVTHNKSFNGVYSGMSQFYKGEEYLCKYKWINNQN